ncbi:type II toxin-antitoxin system VapC family toxin [Ornithinimicrobium sp. F0845]|uniref:type II toxin-antitoxin system VapC family toxin n=1 Tax=Ornithinimicrobium sp. F0845 TaxID=2926412 RepID=UPI001FF2D3DA|nr:type II toxin-antitoxin system VapC family toxin [Ornithinimicrobium sp. F0845]MCK0111690.1 type II toxin-antitoxin system VapC family toxin [Ornithinimicrobium sp. F0845]
MIIADTNVVSEFMKVSPDPAVLAWAHGIDPKDLTICVVTVEEIERGLGQLPDGRRRRDLELRWSRLMDSFNETIAVYDPLAARETATLLVAAQTAGRPMSLADAQIAGICLAGGHHLATRNASDFAAATHLTHIDPFRAV